ASSGPAPLPARMGSGCRARSAAAAISALSPPAAPAATAAIASPTASLRNTALASLPPYGDGAGISPAAPLVPSASHTEVTIATAALARWKLGPTAPPH